MKNLKISDNFLNPYVKLVRDVMLPYQWEVLNDQVEGAEKSHSLENIRIAAGLSKGEFHGMCFQDSDVAKWLEAVAYCIKNSDAKASDAKASDAKESDAKASDSLKKLEEYADEAIGLIKKAQCEDGYFNTYFQIKAPERKFTNLAEAHELYCLGHFIEAAVAYSEATGKREVLDIFCRFADLVDSIFGEAKASDTLCKRVGYPGHQEIELALARLFEATGERRYLDLAAFFLNERGKQPHFFEDEWGKRDGLSIWSGRKEPCPKEHSYSQSHKPVREQTEAVGHAVRAVYMYTGMAEVGRLTGDESLLDACRALFEDICKQMYVTGGIGSTNHGEAFTFAYDLPNDINYSETCASIGLMFFMRAMLKSEPNSAYADVMERALYNTVLASLSTDGKRYFYVNPMETWPKANKQNPARKHVAPERQKWHFCACCPPNTARLLASVGDYLYTVGSSATDGAKSDTVYFHLYAASTFTAEFEGGKAADITVETSYPLGGDVTVTIDSAPDTQMTLAFRVPEWCCGFNESDEGVSCESFDEGEDDSGDSGGGMTVFLGGKATKAAVADGYVCVTRVFNPGDTLKIEFDMEPKFIRANSQIRASAGKVCLQRGPLVYCLEECDNGENLSALLVDTSAAFEEEPGNIGGMECIVIKAAGYRETDPDDAVYSYSQKETQPCALTFVPYHLWGNREFGEMSVWVREA